MVQLLQQPTIIAILILTAAFAIMVWLMVDLRAKWSRYFGDKSPSDGRLLQDLIGRISRSEARLGSVESRINAFEKIAKTSIHKVGFARFNPFHDMGGDQSFSLALLDHEDNGIIISGLYTREGTRVYAKEISGGRPKQALSEEEKRVLDEAINRNI